MELPVLGIYPTDQMRDMTPGTMHVNHLIAQLSILVLGPECCPSHQQLDAPPDREWISKATRMVFSPDEMQVAHDICIKYMVRGHHSIFTRLLL